MRVSELRTPIIEFAHSQWILLLFQHIFDHLLARLLHVLVATDHLALFFGGFWSRLCCQILIEYLKLFVGIIANRLALVATLQTGAHHH